MNLLWEAVKKHIDSGKTYIDRGSEIERLFRSGHTYEDIGVRFCITRERVRQLLVRRGIKRTDGGAAAMHVAGIKAIESQRQKRKEATTFKTFGCSHDEAVAICGSKKLLQPLSPGLKYFQQFRFAKARKIPWEFTLPTWWKVWSDSGKWELRGRGSNRFCMSRLNDKGPYGPTNVRICTNKENIKEGHANRRSGEDNFTRKCLQALRMRNSGMSNVEISKKIGSKNAQQVSTMTCNARRWLREKDTDSLKIWAELTR